MKHGNTSNPVKAQETELGLVSDKLESHPSSIKAISFRIQIILDRLTYPSDETCTEDECPPSGTIERLNYTNNRIWESINELETKLKRLEELV
jgi:hypothetical protein